MKSAVAVALLLLLSSSLGAQARRRPASIPSDGRSLAFDLIDLVNPTPSTPQLHPAYAAQHPAYPAQPAGNLVPASQLRIPPKAVKEYELARKIMQRQHDVQASADHLQKALRIYPDFIQAHNALGLRFIQLGEYQKALAEHETALSLDPRNTQAHQDLSFVLLLLNRNQEAEAEARQTLDLDSQSVSARYVLGRALIAQNHVTPEAIEMLRGSEDAFPDASLVLAQIHFVSGRTDETITDLRQYLRAPMDADNKHKAECWVAQLSQQPAPAGCPAGVTRPSFR
jgi:tetratricopeptide (TPR) repeat protein